jgi:hypothetical protein
MGRGFARALDHEDARLMPSPSAARTAIHAALCALAIAAPAQAQAQNQTKLTAHYTISVARIPVGKIAWSLDIGDGSYATRGTGEASGVASLAVSGKGSVSAQGAVKDGRLDATEFIADITRGDEKSDMRMALDHGTVTDIKAAALAPGDDRVPVTAAHREGILDPLTAWLIPADGVTREACERTLPIFDGQRRFDLKLTFKRMDSVKSDKGYQGAVAVCALSFQPVAGHRASSSLVKYLSQGRDIELWLAPVAGARVLVPIRLSLANMLGNLVVQAHEFQAVTQPATRAALGGNQAAN